MTRRGNIRLVPVTLKEANRLVAEWHSHHKPVIGHKFSIGATVDDEKAGAVIVSRPVAQALDDGNTLEVTRLCCRGVEEGAENRNVASKLLGAATKCAELMGMWLVISYTRVDEDGICYKAAGWVPVAECEGRGWTSGNKANRWLPGFYEPSTEIVDRVRWEWRPPQAIRAVCKGVFALGEWLRAIHRIRRAA